MVRLSLGMLMLVVVGLVGFINPAFAADGGHDAMEFRADTALWALVVFVGLFVILYRKAWPAVLDGLQKREETIRSSLEEAKKTRDEMAAIQAQFKKELAEAHQEIPRLMEEARKKGDELAAQKLAEATTKIQAEQERFRREMEIAKDQAIKELWEQSAKLATLISMKAIGRALTEDDHRRLLDEAMLEMSRSAHN
ncbi:MAG: ATP synthase F0 subunit B [Planctomycetes bacterium]|nr:ATP synthase F0 subunit B [Planctomycetota bacterium]